MIDAADAVVWVNNTTLQVMVRTHEEGVPDEGWGDPIGAHYLQWMAMSDQQRILLMLETAIDLTMRGFEMKSILIAFSTVKQFLDLGSHSYPMCRALTKAHLGKSLEPNTMKFEQLMARVFPC